LFPMAVCSIVRSPLERASEMDSCSVSSLPAASRRSVPAPVNVSRIPVSLSRALSEPVEVVEAAEDKVVPIALSEACAEDSVEASSSSFGFRFVL
jgi:hypothetical protein